MAEVVGRTLAGRVEDMLTTFRVVLLAGARQTGKTTLVNDLLELPSQARFTLDDEGVLSRALEDPVGFVERLPRPAVIDEFQRAGRGLLLAVKMAADRDRARGQLLLTGSANYLADRSMSETLAGRAGRLVLWPLSAGERRGVRETFIDHLFDSESWPGPRESGVDRAELIDWILSGGYPEVVTHPRNIRQRRDWFDTYVHDVVSREALRPMADVRMEGELRKVLRLLAARNGQELVVTDVARDAELNRKTVDTYISLLEALYLVVLVPAWSTSVTTRVKRRPKVLLVDTGLAANICGVGESAFAPVADGVVAGALFEALVLGELHKQASWSEHAVDLAHYRDRQGAEVDLIVEDHYGGRVAGVEVKMTSTPLAKHARHLAMLRDRLGPRFTVGIVIHSGDRVLSMGERLWALPVSALWRSDPAQSAVRSLP